MAVGFDNNVNVSLPQQQQQQLQQQQQHHQTASQAIPQVPNANQDDPGWEDQYRALRTYHLQTGHCRVPARFKANAKLGRWVMTQRRQFTLLMQGLPSALTAERIQRLERLGFTWSVRPEPVTTWNKKFHELKAYKQIYGSCMVPQRYQANQQLGTWVHTQRRQHKLLSEGKKSSMTEEKMKALNSIGFSWDAKHVVASDGKNKDGSRHSNESGDGKSGGGSDNASQEEEEVVVPKFVDIQKESS
ncbi:hypothetical protein ACHAXR_004600 [Thalassiosira sp. AJA248-18]